MEAHFEVGFGFRAGLNVVEEAFELDINGVAIFFGNQHAFAVEPLAGEFHFAIDKAVVTGDRVFLEEDGQGLAAFAGGGE